MMNSKLSIWSFKNNYNIKKQKTAMSILPKFKNKMHTHV